MPLDFMTEEVPDYMLATDLHQVANGKPSVLDSNEWGNETADFGKFALSVTARAVTSAFNTVPTVANWLGGDFEELGTDTVLKAFDDDLAAYYSANRQSVDIVGDVIAMFVPGMAGIKGINLAQKGLAAVNTGSRVGNRIANSFGTLPSLGGEYATKAAMAMKETATPFRILDGNVLKSFAGNYAQGAVEFAAFEAAAAATMQNSPLFEDHTVTDILKNAALGGGVVGLGIMGSVAAAQTYGTLRRAQSGLDKVFNPFRHVSASEEGVDDFARLLKLREERAKFPVPEEMGTDPAIIATQTRLLDKRTREINLDMQTTLTKMAGGDAELGAIMFRKFEELPEDKVWAAALELREASRPSKISKLELEAESARAKGKESDVVVKYLRLWGEDANAIYHSSPGTLNLADTVGSAAELEKEIALRTKRQPVVGNKYTPVGKDHYDVEARYIAAFDTEIAPNTLISGTDLPYLESALAQKVSVSVDGVWMDSLSLREYIKETKKALAEDVRLHIEVDPTVNSAVAAKLLNVKQSVLEGKGYVGSDDSHFFRLQSIVGEDYAKLKEPSTAKIVYRGDPEKVGVDGNVLSGMARIKELEAVQSKVNAQAVTAVLGAEAEKLIPISQQLVLDAASAGSGARALAGASADYGTLGSVVEWLGKVTSELKAKGHKAIDDTFQPLMHQVLQNTTAANEVGLLRHAVLRTGDKYVLAEREGVRRLLLREVDEYEKALIAGKTPVEPDWKAWEAAKVPFEIPIKTDEAWNFMNGLVSHNNSHLRKEKILRNAVGKGMGEWENVVYFPQPSSKNFPYFSFVQSRNPFSGEQTRMIWARTPEELSKLESTVGADFRIIRKSDTDKYYKALKEYDSDLGMTSRDFISEAQRKGTAAPFIPETNANELMEEILSHYKTTNDKQIRDAVSLHNNVAFSELRRMDSEFRGIRSSKKPGKGEDVGVTPFESYVKTALDIPRSSSLPVWTELNNLAENVVTKIFNGVKEGFAKPKTDEQIAALNKHYEDAGFRGIKDALTELTANHPAEKKVLSRFVQSANALFSTLILRTDPMHSLVNGVGSLVLTGSETSYLTRLIKGKGGAEAESFLRDLSEIKLPGTAEYIKSPTKLIASAYKDFFSFLKSGEGDAQALAKFQRFEKNGWMPSTMEQLRSSVDAMTLSGVEGTGELAKKISAMGESTANFLEKAAGGKFAEEMNRYVSAHIADSIAQAGIKYAGLGEKEANAFINTFVNRTQGNYIASQRPLMFQGPIGQSISLFMTYQFNMMQHIFRHLSAEGGRKNAAMLLGLQTSIFGMNGLPAFNFMNQHLVGSASGNTSHSDVYSATMDIPAIGDWLLYGGLSNATGLGLYSRGDMNPRHLTIVPTAIQDVPFISATTGFFSSMIKSAGEVANGGAAIPSLLRGIEHAGISRPLAGLAQVMNGVYRGNEDVYATTTKGNIVAEQDLYSLASLGRIAGARPMDEAVLRDAYYRVQVYEGQDKAKLGSLGAAIKSKVVAREEINGDEIENFMSSYVSAGGSQKNFAKWYQTQVKGAGTNQIKKMVERGNSSYGQYMQKMMIGLEADVNDLE